jgi:hypothetical protein
MRRVKQGLISLFAWDINPLLMKFQPERDEDEEGWQAFEGPYEESLHRIRRHIIFALGRKSEQLYGAKRLNPKLQAARENEEKEEEEEETECEGERDRRGERLEDQEVVEDDQVPGEDRRDRESGKLDQRGRKEDDHPAEDDGNEANEQKGNVEEVTGNDGNQGTRPLGRHRVRNKDDDEVNESSDQDVGTSENPGSDEEEDDGLG